MPFDRSYRNRIYGARAGVIGGATYLLDKYVGTPAAKYVMGSIRKPRRTPGKRWVSREHGTPFKKYRVSPTKNLRSMHQTMQRRPGRNYGRITKFGRPASERYLNRMFRRRRRFRKKKRYLRKRRYRRYRR